jgi:predicted DNA binding CopG/RHH family protein
MNEKYLDNEEKELMESFGKVDPSQVALPTDIEQRTIKNAAREFVKNETKMNIRIDAYELQKIKDLAEEEGLK